MISEAKSPDDYTDQVAEFQRPDFVQLRKTILDNLPEGFFEEMSYGMIGYVVPLTIYPKGYHAGKNLPLPFINIAAQKNYISYYHMAIGSAPELLKWFTNEYPKHCKTKLDMGRGCIRFRNNTKIPFALLGELTRKMEIQDWIALYETQFRNRIKN
jgi:hypothetical protein